TGALSTAAVALAGGTFLIDPTASTAATGVASKFIQLGATNNQLTNIDFAGASQGTVVGPAFQTWPVANSAATANTFSFGTAGGNVAFYTGGTTNNFAARWTGMINITQPGPTTFTTTSDDGTRLY